MSVSFISNPPKTKKSELAYIAEQQKEKMEQATKRLACHERYEKKEDGGKNKAWLQHLS